LTLGIHYWFLNYFFYGRGHKNHQLGRGFFVHHRVVSAGKSVEFVADHRMSYIVLRGCRCNIILLNERAPTKEKNDNSKASFYEEIEQVGNDSLHQDCNNNDVRIVNFATSKNLVDNSIMFLH